MVWFFLGKNHEMVPLARRVAFSRLLPYQGFTYFDTGAANEKEKETSEDAVFAATMSELVEDRINKLKEQTADKQRMIELLNNFYNAKWTTKPKQ